MTLPQGWVETTLGNVVTLNYGASLPASSREPGKVPVFGSNGVVGSHSVGLVPGPAIIVGRKGSAGKIHPSLGESYPIDTTYYIDDFDVVDFKFAEYLLGSLGLDKLDRATAIPGLNREDAYRILVAIPPSCEQRRIVAKLEGLTARLALTRKELERVAALGMKLRQSVLSRAFSGNLTAAWRKQEGYADVDWQTCPLSEIAEVQGGIQVGKKRPADAVLVEVPYLRVANVQRGWLRLDEIKTLAVTAEERDRLLLKDGDILMNEGGDRDKLGRGWVWRDQVPGCVHQNHVFRVRLKDPDFPPEFVSHYANEFGQPYFIDQGTQTTNLASISKRRVMALPVPVPPVAEAKKIVRLITAAFARADRLEAEATRARKLLDRLEAAILAKAFRGELVPQDPNDEPASVLLDRIRAERAAAPKPKRGRARKAVG